MMKRKKWMVLMMVSLMAFSVLGCGESKDAEGNVSIIEKPLPVKADNPQVKKFDQELGEIKDQETAEKAVNTFVDYVDSRIDKKSHGPSAQSVRAFMTPSFVKEIARQEVLARKGEAITVQSSLPGEEEFVKPLIDVGTLTDQVNDLGKEAGFGLDDEGVNTAKLAVEESIPNLNSDKKEEMTPLNAMAVGYALVSGDDGSAEENSVELPVEKVGIFVEEITQ